MLRGQNRAGRFFCSLLRGLRNFQSCGCGPTDLFPLPARSDARCPICRFWPKSCRTHSDRMADFSNDQRTSSSKGLLSNVSFLYLIRHAQAGPRHNYDTLSEIGEQQARLLGTYLANRLISLSVIVTGTLERHRRTAELVTREICRHGIPVAQPTVDCRWNEFILAELYQHYGSRMAKENPDYAGDYLAME